MKKSLFNKMANGKPAVALVTLFVLLAVGCKQRTATEMEQTVDTAALRADTTATQPDRTNVEPDSVPASGVIEPGEGEVTKPSSGSLGDAKRPGEMPKPGTISTVDSIKNSYPPKK